MTIRSVTFDVYSALFDTLTGLSDALTHPLRRRGIDSNSRPLARAWRQKHMEYLLVATALDREAPPNRRAIELSASYVLRTLHPPLDTGELSRLTAAWEHLPPWPEAGEVLLEVRARPLILAALSNGDMGMLHTLLGRLPVRFDHVISTEGGPSKPHPAVYMRALRVLEIPAENLLHVAGSPTDAMGATAAGIRTVWINRSGDAVLDPSYAPAHECSDLSGVLSILHNSTS
ncbi:MAG TPA: HAD-IA family hydrolase [bacterium]